MSARFTDTEKGLIKQLVLGGWDIHATGSLFDYHRCGVLGMSLTDALEALDQLNRQPHRWNSRYVLLARLVSVASIQEPTFLAMIELDTDLLKRINSEATGSVES